jgi:hypothetical protein
LELGQHGGRKRKVEDIKRPEQLVREFRDRVKYSTCCELVLFQNLLFL